MRIIAGTARGRALKAPRGRSIRPTSDRVRQAIFDVLGQSLPGERVLDLYAGTGALGLEAISRGAAHAVLVDSSAEAARLCQRNAGALGFAAAAQVRKLSVVDAVARLRGEAAAFTLVFADPPYAARAAAAVADLVGEGSLLAPTARLVLEHGRREPVPARAGVLGLVEDRRFGDTVVAFYARDR